MSADEPQPLRTSLRGLSWARLITAGMVLIAGTLLRYAGSFPFHLLPFVLAASAAGLVSCFLLIGSVRGANAWGIGGARDGDGDADEDEYQDQAEALQGS